MGARVLLAATAARFFARLAEQASGRNMCGAMMVDSSRAAPAWPAKQAIVVKGCSAGHALTLQGCTSAVGPPTPPWMASGGCCCCFYDGQLHLHTCW